MKAKRVREVRDLVASEAFKDWHLRYHRMRGDVEDLRETKSDLSTQAEVLGAKADLVHQSADEVVFSAGEIQDLAANAHAEFAEIENNSFETLSTFETQRQRAADTATEADRAEKILEDFRANASELRARLEAVRKQHDGHAASEQERLRAEVSAMDERIEQQRIQVARLHERVKEQDAHREELWLDVEDTWSAAFRANMARAEYTYHAQRLRERVEFMYGQATEERTRAEALLHEAEEKRSQILGLEDELDEHRARGRETFEAVLVEDFLYWPHHGDVHMALCVPLIDESSHLNVQVRALSVYQVERGRGIEFIEPVPPEDIGDEDPRLDHFFVDGRPSG